MNDQPYAASRGGLHNGDCHFYHTMDVPGHAVVQGDWDLRGRLDSDPGDANLAGKSVLENRRR